MNKQQVEAYVMRYLEATDSHVIEKAPTHVTVKLSPQADKDLTNRPYYWGFVERTGVPPETMTFTFVFDPENMPAPPQPRPTGVPLAPMGVQAPSATGAAQAPSASGATAQPAGTPPVSPTGSPPASSTSDQPAPSGAATSQAGSTPTGQPDSILGRYFGTPVTVMTGPGRIPRDTVTFGSRRLEQLFDVTRSRGGFVRLFEAPGSAAGTATASGMGPASAAPTAAGHATGSVTAGASFAGRAIDPAAAAAAGSRAKSLTPWLGVNFKLELACDMKRDELHSLGINLVTGDIREQFMNTLLPRSLSPHLAAGSLVMPSRMTVTRAATQLEAYLERAVKEYDHSWADEAMERHAEEMERIDLFYEELLKKCEEEETAAATRQQFEHRRLEIDWQYRPRVRASVINCGLFYLLPT